MNADLAGFFSWGFFKRVDSIGQMMKGLFVNGEDGHLRLLEKTRLIECADFDENQTGRSRGPADHVGSAISAELSCDRIFKIASSKGFCGSI